jgi:transcriptional regulator with PAS, ATPase and Fis domain
VDVRVIAATNKNLEQEMAEGRFREDLYYRLNVVPILLPPLRERKEDIPKLIDYFLEKYNLRCQKEEVKGLTREVRDLLLKHSYPGNVRELENIIERAIVLTRHEYLTLQDLPSNLRSQPSEGELWPEPGRSLDEAVSAVERQMIERALRLNEGIQTRAAEFLGISERVLRYKMKKYNLLNVS